MTDNSIISEARGECRHDGVSMQFGGAVKCGNCGKMVSGTVPTPDYTDLSAWTPELYQWIEDEGLWQTFVIELIPNIDTTMIKVHEALWMVIAWECATASPAQKASALAKAIKESSQG